MTFLFLACVMDDDRGARTLLDVRTDTSEDAVAEDQDTYGYVEAWVELTSPGDGELVQNPVVFTIDSHEVREVRIDADGWELGRWDPTDSDSLTYTFSGVGVPRVVTLEGLTASGRVVASDTLTITVEDETGSGSTSTVGYLDLPYYFQYDNAYEPSATCGITSTAMVLSYFGGTVTPDDLYRTYGKSQGQSPSGIEQLYGWHGLHGDSGYYGTRSEIREHLDDGRPVVVHGYWTSAGHISVIVGYDADGWIVHDPAGDWYVGYGWGSGEAVHYPYGGGWDDDLSWDGDIWWSAASTSAF